MRSISAEEDRRISLLREFEGSWLTKTEFCRRREVGLNLTSRPRAAPEPDHQRRPSANRSTTVIIGAAPNDNHGHPPLGGSSNVERVHAKTEATICPRHLHQCSSHGHETNRTSSVAPLASSSVARQKVRHRTPLSSQVGGIVLSEPACRRVASLHGRPNESGMGQPMQSAEGSLPPRDIGSPWI